MGEVLVKDSLTWMALVVEDKVWESREQTTKAGLMIGEQVRVKNQVLKIADTVMVMVIIEAFLW